MARIPAELTRMPQDHPPHVALRQRCCSLSPAPFLLGITGEQGEQPGGPDLLHSAALPRLVTPESQAPLRPRQRPGVRDAGASRLAWAL